MALNIVPSRPDPGIHWIPILLQGFHWIHFLNHGVHFLPECRGLLPGVCVPLPFGSQVPLRGLHFLNNELTALNHVFLSLDPVFDRFLRRTSLFRMCWLDNDQWLIFCLFDANFEAKPFHISYMYSVIPVVSYMYFIPIYCSLDMFYISGFCVLFSRRECNSVHAEMAEELRKEKEAWKKKESQLHSVVRKNVFFCFYDIHISTT